MFNYTVKKEKNKRLKSSRPQFLNLGKVKSISIIHPFVIQFTLEQQLNLKTYFFILVGTKGIQSQSLLGGSSSQTILKKKKAQYMVNDL